MPSKNIAEPLVLGVLFVSLIAIFQATSQSPVVAGISVILLAIALVIAIDGSQREMVGLAVISALVSVVAAGLVGNAGFGVNAGVLLAIVWGLVLLGLVNWYQRNAYVPDDRAILISSNFSGRPTVLRSANARPVMPLMERVVAEIPLYDLDENVSVTNVNTRAGHNINAIKVQVRYRVVDPTKVLRGVPNQGQALNEIARSLGKTADSAATEVVFWEKLVNRQITQDIDDIVRKVVYNYPYVEDAGTRATAADAYLRRNELTEEVYRQMSELSATWGVQIVNLELEHFDVDSSRFKAVEAPASAPAPAAAPAPAPTPAPAPRAPAETPMVAPSATVAATVAAPPAAATAAPGTLDPDVERIRTLVRVLKESGVPLTEQIIEDIVIGVLHTPKDAAPGNGRKHVAGTAAEGAPAGRK
ncbi:MAG TPA: SPFH domain-containing protein [Roseiflexaceae bacterium]|nr:SPFH domain-containing protein [Roseiflexaceae bacterium]